MAATTYTVVKGDTLWAISQKYNTTVSNLVKLNNIKNPDYIVVGQVLKLSGTPDAPKTNTTYRANIDLFGLQSNTDRTLYATWTWSKSYTENYQVRWYYDTGDGVWFVGTDSTVTDKQSLYNAPNNAKRVKCKVKPVSKKRKVNNKETSYWTASWSTEKTYTFAKEPPAAPPTPTIKLDDATYTIIDVELNNLNYPSSTKIEFEVVQDNSKVFTKRTVSIKTAYATFRFTGQKGHEYKVRCRAIQGSLTSEWSDYSTYTTTAPATPEIVTCKASSQTSVYIEWKAVKTATQYVVESATEKKFFEGSTTGQIQSHIVKASDGTHVDVTGLELGHEYFWRVRADNEHGKSDYSKVYSVVVGTDPVSPTTWSSTTTVVTGEPLTLYWIHNNEDGSSQTFAQLELTIGENTTVHTIQNTTDPDEKDKTSSYSVDTSKYPEGTTILWRVRTAGIIKKYGEWSVQRTVHVYAKPTVALSITNSKGEFLDVLESFPIYISAETGPSTQLPISYTVSVIANESYETVDGVGNVKIVSEGEAVYTRNFDISTSLLIELSANSLDLENNIPYTLKCSATMDSGLTAEASSDFTVSWTDMEYAPNAEIAIDEVTCSASLRLHCEDEDGQLVEDVLLSAYRRELDGTFTEIATNIENSSGSFVFDPHPALNYARYRIVATTKSTGAVSYYDIPDYPVNEKAAIIQWDEEWTGFETTNEDEIETPSWAGSMLRLPYNVDFSNKYDPEVSLVKYIGRRHPVSYYGTQVGESSTLSVAVAKDDTETLNALYRLSIWNGDVYVRSPSGIGYWANVRVSFGEKHRELTVPVTIEATRVEGGM